ncbi:MAG: helix-turn-helix transcriptional regulator [Anaerolineales bacterium]|nr:helix-turn-helix transcriptional regulator [Anaerolineales bacterium]
MQASSSQNPQKAIKASPLEAIGRRIARLRQQQGWTQQSLAERLAVSRVAISHIEMDLTIPSERTIVLLAGLFKITPHALVLSTTYPQAKAERLPEIACCYTTLELQLALLENDLAWLERLTGQPQYARLKDETLQKWSDWLHERSEDTIDERELAMIAAARLRLDEYYKSQPK